MIIHARWRSVAGRLRRFGRQRGSSVVTTEEARRNIDFVDFCGTEPPTPEDVLAYRRHVLERYAEVVKRAGLPLNEEGTVDWQAVIEEERQKLNQQTESR